MFTYNISLQSSIKIKHVSLEGQDKSKDREKTATGGGGWSGGVYLIFGTRRFVECHLNSELIIRQAADPLAPGQPRLPPVDGSICALP